MEENLVVDIGNTRAKVAVVRGHEVVELRVFDSVAEEAMAWIGEVAKARGIGRAVVCSTRGDGAEVAERVREVVDSVLLFDAQVAVPMDIAYSTPETLGRDRVAAAVGAMAIYGEGYEALLVVDMGSAMTIDYVTRERGFEGGVISPGVEMRFRALHEFTAKLPLCHPTEEERMVARSTREAIEQGVMEGIKFEVEGNIRKFGQLNGKNCVIFTGGDAKYLANRIKNAIFAECEVVIVGLNIILMHNAK